MDTNKKMDMICAMRVYGGSFVQALGVCFMTADQNNFQRLLIAFPEYVEQYTEMGAGARKDSEEEE